MTLIIQAQGNLLKVLDTTRQEAKKAIGGKRGNVSGTSAAARRRLMRLMATLDVDTTRCVFLTLTFHGLPTYEKAKRNLKAFLMRMRRKFPNASAIWRMELQERGSIHFHLICFNLPYWHYSDLQAAWTQVTGEDISGIDIRLVKDRSHAMSYVSKYVAKSDVPRKQALTLQARIMNTARIQRNLRYPAELAPQVPAKLGYDAYQHDKENGTGRTWGIFNKKALPFAVKKVAIIQDMQLERYLKWHIKAQTKIVQTQDARAFYLFAEDAYEMLEYANKTAATSGTIAYEHVRIIQRSLAHIERVRSKFAYTPRVTQGEEATYF